MARRSAPAPEEFEEHIVDIDVGDEMRTSYLEYAYSVIYSRALPDARDGLKPVQRRILYAMHDMGLRPERGHVKSSRVVGEVMGRFHPHGDGAIYDALVRMAQPWSMRLPTVDGHGNFGSPDDPPAAMRYTEARMAPAAVAMTGTIDEDTVDFRPNYDGRELEPVVLPAAIPHLVVNGASGIAVGMATNMAPHNLVEVIQALRHLVKHPDADLDALDALRARPRPAHGRQDHRPRRRPRRLRGRPRQLPHAGDGAHRERHPAPQGHRRHRAAVRRGPRARDRPDLRAGEVQEAPGHQRRRRPHRRQEGHAARHRGQERLPPRGDPRAALQEHPAGGVVRHQRRLPGRRPAPDAGAQGAAGGLPRPPLRRRAPPHDLPPRQGRRPAAPRRGPAAGDHRHRRGDPADPRQRQRRDGARAADERLRPHRDPGQLHPRHAAPPAHEVLQDRARQGGRRAAPHDRGARRDPGRRRPAAHGRLRRARRGGEDVRDPSPYRPAGVVRPDQDRDGHASRGRRRPLLRLPVLLGTARPHDHARGSGRRRCPHPPRRHRLGRRHDGSGRDRRGHLGRPGGQARRPRPADAAQHGQPPQPPGRGTGG